jgi:hypothetical protein
MDGDSTLRRRDPIDPLARLINGDDLTADDLAILRATVRRAMRERITLDTALGGGWRRALGERLIKRALASGTLEGDSDLAKAQQAHRDAQHYASTRYPADLDRDTPADPADAISFAMLQMDGGEVASLVTYRRRVTAATTRGELTAALINAGDDLINETSDDEDMAIRRKPVDPAITPTEATAPQQEPLDLEAYLADVRLPELRRERDEVDHRLREIFAVHRFDIDFDWRQSDEANEVAVLLTGRAAPAEAQMPPGALHASLLRRRAALDKAIARCEYAAARVAERRLEERLAAAKVEITALVRERWLAARHLQRLNRRLIALSEQLGVDPTYGLPSSGFDLLGWGLPGDEVSTLGDALLACGIISRKDLLDE